MKQLIKTGYKLYVNVISVSHMNYIKTKTIPPKLKLDHSIIHPRTDLRIINQKNLIIKKSADN